MSLKEKTHFLNLGNCGGKIGKIFVNEMNYQGTFGNGSTQDLKLLGNVPNTHHLRNFDGFGGFRDRALSCLAENEEFMSAVSSIKEKIIFIPFGAGGSTGSGCSTVLAELLLEEKDEDGRPEKIVCPIVVLPASNESVAKHRNAYQAVQELMELQEFGLGATFFVSNDSSEDYSYINNTFARMLDAFLSNDSYGEINNFDESEKIEMLRDGGAMVISQVGSDKEATVILEKLTKKGIFAPIETDKVCENIAIIHCGKDNTDIKANDVIAEVGKPSNVFEGYNNKGCTLVVASGLSYPVSHVRKLGELAQAVSEERQRNKSKSVQKLSDLKLVDTSNHPIKEEKVQKKPSKLDMLRQKQAKIQQN